MQTEGGSAACGYLRATVAYDGTDFLGFQWQPAGRTVQGVLEAALGQVTQTAIRVVGSGRTDRGVHAQGQVIAFHAVWRHPLADLHRALNAVLPADVVLKDLRPAPADWHPRFSALWRHYRYTVLNQPVRSPLDRRYAHLVAGPLDVAAMQTAAARLVGEHDFAGYGQPPRGGGGQPTQGDSTVRRLFDARWLLDGPWFTFDVVGNAFLRGMVRRLVGTLLYVGAGVWPVERVAEILVSRDRALAAPPAPASGLCLMHVEYDTRPEDLTGAT
ncbi:MAG: tRNA pseudouridine(38-40) synthase TruA [Anaerolineae bacterium CG2_30_64_16]|nr:MAG: tRNA pseudouridine(38-40) synthase TruA [Anaerolineae bacterium CG2_30_64_16]